MRRAFAAPHPLEHGVIGLPEQLAQVTAAADAARANALGPLRALKAR